MRVEIEARVSGKRGRMKIWTIERDADLAAGKGIGLELAFRLNARGPAQAQAPG